MQPWQDVETYGTARRHLDPSPPYRDIRPLSITEATYRNHELSRSYGDVFMKVDVNMGYVYILTNQSFRYGLVGRKLIKIGKTNRDPDERAQELSSTSVPTPFKVAYALPSDQYDELERKMHRRLDTYRSNKNREFFKYPVKKAIKLLHQLSNELSRVEQQPLQFEQATVKNVRIAENLAHKRGSSQRRTEIQRDEREIESGHRFLV